MKSIIAWLVELTLECVLGAYVVFLVYGPNRTDISGLENVRVNIGFVLFFILASGYFATTAWFGVIRQRGSVRGQLWVNVLLFCAHAGGFLVLTGTQIERTVGVLVLGVGVVAFASLIGSSLRAWGSKPTDAEL
ncbi:MAG TPA: hypothetical protein VGL58_03355 [Caulobacteraceae bacterium]